MIYLSLFWEFFRTGLFAVGGGLATLPFLTEIATKHPDWFTKEMLSDMIAISESTPGPIGVNMSTYAGYSAAGIPGAIIATLSLVLPSLIIIIIVAKFLTHFSDNKYVQNAFSGLRPAVTGLIAAAGFSVVKTAFFVKDVTFLKSINFTAIIIFAVLLTLMQLKPLKKIHPTVYLAVSAVVGIILKMH